MTKYLRITNWDRWQSYRSDRGQPPWIKLHRSLMRNPEWVSLNDKQRGQLVAIWLSGADRGGVILASPAILKKLCFMDTEPDIELFISLNFIDPDVIVASSWRQVGVNMRQDDASEKVREGQRRGEGEELTPSPTPDLVLSEYRPPATPKQKNYAESVLKKHDLTLNDYIQLTGHTGPLSSDQVDDILRLYGKAPDKAAKEKTLEATKNKTFRRLKAELTEIHHAGGAVEAESFIQEQPESFQAGLTAHLKISMTAPA